MNVKQISILLENKPGSLYDIAETLAAQDINIRALTVAETGDMALTRFVVDNVLWTISILKNEGYSPTFSDVIVAKISNVPGGLSRILHVLKENSINIEHTYSLINRKISKDNVNSIIGFSVADAYMVFEVSDVSKASDVLKRSGIKIIQQEELSAL